MDEESEKRFPILVRLSSSDPTEKAKIFLNYLILHYAFCIYLSFAYALSLSCVLSIFFFHLFINVGMVLGLTPVIGIPLPLFSYGGSSLWGFTILLFVFLRMDAGRIQH